MTSTPIATGHDPVGGNSSAFAPEFVAPPRASASALTAVFGRQIWVAVRFLVAMTVVTGILYPLLIWGAGQLIATHQANGTLLHDPKGDTVGSSLVGQNFEGDQWFQGRPSAAGKGYDAMSSGGSNLSADSDTLLESVQNLRASIAEADGVDPSQVPPDALTASASGLDPNISPQYAGIQIDRVAAARKLPVAQITALVNAHTEGRTLGFIGQPRVNVLELNLALAALSS